MLLLYQVYSNPPSTSASKKSKKKSLLSFQNSDSDNDDAPKKKKKKKSLALHLDPEPSEEPVEDGGTGYADLGALKATQNYAKKRPPPHPESEQPTIVDEPIVDEPISADYIPLNPNASLPSSQRTSQPSRTSNLSREVNQPITKHTPSEILSNLNSGEFGARHLSLLAMNRTFCARNSAPFTLHETSTRIINNINVQYTNSSAFPRNSVLATISSYERWSRC